MIRRILAFFRRSQRHELPPGAPEIVYCYPGCLGCYGSCGNYVP